MFQKDKKAISDEIESLSGNGQLRYEGSEWLETNGLGGWAGSSLCGCNTRRYHGLLVAAVLPPADRMVLLSKLEETIVTGVSRIELGTNIYDRNIIHPRGYECLESFSRNLFPEWYFEVNGIKLKKCITMVHGENTTLVLYEVLKSPASFTLELLPLVAARGYHQLQQSHYNMFWDVDFANGVFRNQPGESAPELFISVPGATYSHHPGWYYNFEYPVEKYRGLDYTEDLFNHGTFSVTLQQGDRLGIIVSTENPSDRDPWELFENEKKRKSALLGQGRKPASSAPLSAIQQLVLAADQFIVRRSENLKTVIAGYHWFTDWGRDTMISLPGLCLSTGRFDDAKKIIEAFAAYVSMGMLPNRFPDNDQPPEYNNVDGTLWYFIAVYDYLRHTGDNEFVLGRVLPVLKEIVNWHFRGTRYNIHVDEDELLFAGEQGVQLTWMDAKIGDWVVTPRIGKPVEIQALWYNALLIFAELLQSNGEIDYATEISRRADRLRGSFLEKFWYKDGHYLYDVIDDHGNGDTSLRPNQLFTVSLPFPLIEGDQAKEIVAIITEKLYTPKGLRTLPADDPAFIPIYGGDPLKRDSAYHEGTVWPWLLGSYVDALIKTGQTTAAEDVIEAIPCHLQEGCIGSASEIFDATEPYYPRGCVAQAWSVGELLRVIKNMGRMPAVIS